MPDRDPVLDKALDEWYRTTYKPTLGRIATFEVGWHAAFRSLGCATPEAQVALRELVTRASYLDGNAEIAMRKVWTEPVLQAARTFALLTTPPEEGR